MSAKSQTLNQGYEGLILRHAETLLMQETLHGQ